MDIENQTYLEALNILLNSLRNSKAIPKEAGTYAIINENYIEYDSIYGLCGWIVFLGSEKLISDINKNLLIDKISKDLRKINPNSSYLFPRDKNTLINRVNYIENLINEINNF